MPMQLEAQMLTLIEAYGLGEFTGSALRLRKAQLEAAQMPAAMPPHKRHSSPVSPRFRLFPRDDADQRLRQQRYLIAAATSLMFVSLLALCFMEGALEAAPFAAASAATIAAVAAFYVIFRLGLNKRAGDRSLTVPMMLCATCTVTLVLYFVGPARPVFLLMYPVILFFGVFRLTTRKLLGVTAVALSGYAGVIVLLQLVGPGIARPHIEMLQWMVLAAVLIWFSFMGGYVNHLHNRLKESEFDALTGAYTRRRILEVLDHEKIRCDRGAGPLCVAMLDIDRFKQVNDSFGHPAGDEVLRRSAAVAQKDLRAIDFMGRYGGEEFLLVLTQTDLDGAWECAERVRERTARTEFEVGSGEHRMTVSIGVAQYRPGETARDLLARADAALYRAKDGGRNRVECE
jgi:diguanylate cyclase (GGDEF)-like protein